MPTMCCTLRTVRHCGGATKSCTCRRRRCSLCRSMHTYLLSCRSIDELPASPPDTPPFPLHTCSAWRERAACTLHAQCMSLHTACAMHVTAHRMRNACHCALHAHGRCSSWLRRAAGPIGTWPLAVTSASAATRLLPRRTVCHTGLEPRTSRHQAGLLLTRASLALDRLP